MSTVDEKGVNHTSSSSTSHIQTTFHHPSELYPQQFFNIYVSLFPIYIVMFFYIIYRIVSIVIQEKRFLTLKLLSNYFLTLSIYFKYRSLVGQWFVLELNSSANAALFVADPNRRATISFENSTSHISLVLMLASYTTLLVFWIGLYHNVFKTRRSIFVGVSKQIFIVHTCVFMCIGITTGVLSYLRDLSPTIYDFGHTMFYIFLIVLYGTSFLIAVGFIIYGVLIWKTTRSITKKNCRASPNNRILILSLLMATIILGFFSIFVTTSLDLNDDLFGPYGDYTISLLDYYFFILICVGIMVLLLRKPVTAMSVSNEPKSPNGAVPHDGINPTCTTVGSTSMEEYNYGGIQLKQLNPIVQFDQNQSIMDNQNMNQQIQEIQQYKQQQEQQQDQQEQNTNPIDEDIPPMISFDQTKNNNGSCLIDINNNNNEDETIEIPL
ncbi:hypothetical protein DFA_00952 [Cavenderia fasciculata]|uniref:THH1/TOM1/TOM3 domain-containing protein n=1 Tax=Cavenderia fasciculata TaxID=261658 RepID=F4PUQ8_CACFS|nr:uncharacterized protein DFA_00952 [Cavenderia fasciculata]EGG21077.1 hypothetical protein DFA_00952 [Cavenderia fasciculata]|eukprot:XP_004358927.1 hypothetical protein DFA_00952 [Cavenderia fasciculata]